MRGLECYYQSTIVDTVWVMTITVLTFPNVLNVIIGYPSLKMSKGDLEFDMR